MKTRSFRVNENAREAAEGRQSVESPQVLIRLGGKIPSSGDITKGLQCIDLFEDCCGVAWEAYRDRVWRSAILASCGDASMRCCGGEKTNVPIG